MALTIFLQVCLMEHFLGNPISYLCCDKSELVRRAQSLNKDDLELFRSLPSFKVRVNVKSDITEDG